MKMDTAKAGSEEEAEALVQSAHPGMYAHCFGQVGDSFDVALYDSKEDFEMDAEENGNERIQLRIAVKCDRPNPYSLEDDQQCE